MELWTIQLAKWRLVRDKGLPLLDITVKSGDQIFAPHGWALGKIKAGQMSEDEYTRLYRQKMRESLRDNRTRWLEVCRMDVVVIACYCPAGCYCHRYLLKDYLEKLCVYENIEFVYKGELT